MTAVAILSAIASLSARTVAAAEAIVPIVPLRVIFRREFLTAFDELFFAVITFILIVALAALLVLIVEPRPIFAEHPEVMIRELQEIFGLHPIAGELRITRHALVFLEQLRRVATLAIVLPVTGLSAEILPPLPTTAAPAAALSIIDQIHRPYAVSFNPFASGRQGGAV